MPPDANTDKSTAFVTGKALRHTLAISVAAAMFVGGLLYLTSPTRILNQTLSCDYEWLEIRLTQTGQKAEFYADLNTQSLELAKALQYLTQAARPKASGTSSKAFRSAWKVFVENSDLLDRQSLKALTIQAVDSDAQQEVAVKAFKNVMKDAEAETQQLLAHSNDNLRKSQIELRHQTAYMAQQLKNPIGLSTLDNEQRKHEMPFWGYLARSPSHAACEAPSILASVAKWRSS